MSILFEKKKIIILGIISIILIFAVFDLSDDNKAKISKPSQAPNVPSVTFGKFEEKKEKTVNVLFVGDLMFDRYIRQVSQRKGNDFIFQDIRDLLFSLDLVVANLEGPITNNSSQSIGSKIGEKNNYIFTFDKSVADTLESHNIRLVNLGNNHILNFGEAGLDQTEQFLDAAKVNYFGDYRGNGKRIFIKEINGIRLGFVNFNQFTKGAKYLALNDISEARKISDFLIVYTHWGNEYVTTPSESIVNLAHEFVDQGADLIIGSHPHVVQGSEDYKGKKIYYSLGNFIFDQYEEKNTMQGLAVKTVISRDSLGINFTEIPLKMLPSGQTKLSVTELTSK